MSDKYTGIFDRRMAYALCTVDGGVYVFDPPPYQGLGKPLNTVDGAIEYLGKLSNILFTHGSRSGKLPKARKNKNWIQTKNPKNSSPNKHKVTERERRQHNPRGRRYR